MPALVRLYPFVLLLLALSACGGNERRTSNGPLVLAAISLQNVLTDAADEWERRGNARPLLAFSGTPAVVRMAESGAPGDLLITADEDWMDRAEEAEVVRSASRVDLASNRLVLIAPSDALLPADPLEPGRLAAMLGSTARIAMADPASVPAGRYGRTALERLGIWSAVENAVVPADSVRGALRLVATGEARFGVVYATDAAMEPGVAVVATFPRDSHPPIRYPLALLAASSHPDAGAFRDFLLSRDGEALLRKRGFVAQP